MGVEVHRRYPRTYRKVFSPDLHSTGASHCTVISAWGPQWEPSDVSGAQRRLKASGSPGLLHGCQAWVLWI